MGTDSKKANPDTALAISRDIVGQVMIPADFAALDALITKLGDRSSALSAEETTAATQIVDAWDRSVTERISANAHKAGDVLAFLDGKSMYGGTVDEIVEMFHAAVGDTPAYQGYVAALQDYAATQADAPMDVPVESAMTVTEADQVALANRAARLEHDRRMKAAEYKYMRAVKAYIAEANAMPEIKDVRAKLSAYKRKANRMAAECRDKATRAKLNITISDPATRDLLREMMDFAKNV